MRLFAVFAIGVCSFAHSATPESAALTVSALDLLGKGKAESAEFMFYRALLLDPQNGVALHEAAKLQIKNGDRATAAQFLLRAEKALKHDSSQAMRYKEVAALLKNTFPQAAQLKEAIEEYRGTLERVVNANNNELVRETVQERAQALGIEVKITAREQHLIGFAAVEISQNLDVPIGILSNGSSILMNFEQQMTGVPNTWNNLKFNKIRYGEAQCPSIRIVKPGKVIILVSTKDPTPLKEIAEACKQLKATKSSFQIGAGDQVFDVYTWDAADGKTVNFKHQVVICAAEMTQRQRK